ncbi:hypothetical protein [Croceimicrobium hydrocarbonivorans]|uniref:Lipoprotein n=1 Tax=Croceimicrobium hydrocarbonivorans TaxID=2761580 RepID=A0A7H0VIY0_9FLAO|nr:hypothetical protein [Croceimicrobium hydrocarbonivorans]QNR25678.1 hypothetical protein H4K34_07510 [Croceimicrobium hydrocarbonivorans]
MKKRWILFLLILGACQQNPASEDANLDVDQDSLATKNPKSGSLPAIDTLKGFQGKSDLKDSLGTTYLDFGSFAFILQGRFEQQKEGDSIQLYEALGLYFYQKKFRPEILDSDLSLKLYLSKLERVMQVFPHPVNDPTGNYSKWLKSRQSWQEWSPYQYLNIEEQPFRMPQFNAGSYEDPPARIFEKLALHDTLIEYPGEMGGTTAEFLYLDKPANYSIPRARIKIEVYRKGILLKHYFLLLHFSYGC